MRLVAVSVVFSGISLDSPFGLRDLSPFDLFMMKVFVKAWELSWPVGGWNVRAAGKLGFQALRFLREDSDTHNVSLWAGRQLCQALMLKYKSS